MPMLRLSSAFVGIWRARTVLAASLLQLLGWAAAAQAQDGVRPCDILERARTPCVAAHSTTRALYGGYDGPLYRVRRGDGQARDIRTLGRGGIADAKAQDDFCARADCIVARIYDQSPERNDLTIEGPGGAGRADRGANAAALPVTIAGRRVYGILIEPGMGYRNNATHGVAMHGQPETMLMVTSSLHVNARCCFDYGNVERNSKDNGNGHMDALNFSMICRPPPPRVCLGRGPWVQADLENGLFMSARGGNANSTYRGNPTPFVTALLKNDGIHVFAMKAGDAQRGRLELIYRGHLPLWKPGYSPMQQEGAIVLGTGGDNSNGSAGSFFEGFMTAGVTSPQTDDAIQANIVAAAYGGLARR